MLRHIAWFNGAQVEPSEEGFLTSKDEVVSRRCLAPARAIEKCGVSCSVFGNLDDADPTHVSQHLQKLNADIVVIGKILGPSLIKLARAAKHLGCYVVADFGHEMGLTADHIKLAEIADQMVAATKKHSAIILEKTGLTALVISDCEEKSLGEDGPEQIAQMWMEVFQQLKLKPPVCANTNNPSEKAH